MSVFTLNTITDLTGQVRVLANRFTNAHPLTITAREFIDGFIQPDHVPVLKQTEEICGRIGNTSSVSFFTETANRNGFRVVVSFAGEAPIIIPDYVRNGLRADAPADIRSKIQDWVEHRFNYGVLFGDAVDALFFLNEVCADARSMTVMLPILPTLMRNINAEADSRTAKRAKRLAELKSVGSLPILPRAVTQRLQDISHLMTAVNMIEGVERPRVESGGATLEFYSGYDVPKRQHMFAGIKHVSEKQPGTFV